MNKIVVITPTKDREEQLSLVRECMENQTLKPDYWVIADDSAKSLDWNFDKISVPIKYFHTKRFLRVSSVYNSIVALSGEVAEKYIVFEDDDYYPPKYIEHVSKLLDERENNCMIGNSRWIDYRLSTGYYRERTKECAQPGKGDTLSEWHQSAIKGEMLKNIIISVLKNNLNDLYPDCVCYRTFFRNGRFPCYLSDFGENSAISLKDYGVGTPGVIEPHRSNNNLIKDEGYVFFKEKLGQDWKKYEKYLGRLDK